MISWLKHYFVPYTGNNHRPHSLRSESVRGIAFLILLFELFIFIGLTVGTSGSFSFTASVLPAILGDLTNKERATEHLVALTESPLLDRIATLKAEDMARKGYFAHTSPEGLTPWYWFDQVGYEYEYAGENLAVDFTDSYDVTSAWMNSKTHRANIVKDVYTEIGTGVASGTYDGVPTVFVAQIYAKPVTKNVNTPLVAPVTEKIPVRTVTTTTTSATTTITPQVLGVTFENIDASWWQKIILSPLHTAQFIFRVIALWILIALAIHLFVRKDKKHVDLVLNSIILLVIIVAFCIINIVLTNRTTETSFQAFDASGVVTQEK